MIRLQWLVRQDQEYRKNEVFQLHKEPRLWRRLLALGHLVRADIGCAVLDPVRRAEIPGTLARSVCAWRFRRIA